MRMVASAKLHHVQGMTENFLCYKDKLQEIVDSLQLTADSSMRTDDQQGDSQLSTLNSQLSTLLIPVSSNSGLCGAFNSNIAKATFQRMEALKAQGKEVLLLPIGKKIAHELKKAGIAFDAGFIGLIEAIEKSNTFSQVPTLVKTAVELHQHKEIDGAEFVYHHFKSMGTQVITTTPLPLAMPQMRTKKSEVFLTEPTPDELLSSLWPRLLNAQAYGILLDSLTSEHAARMLAMQTADDNANDLLKELTLLYNKTRQQAITNELIDIMGGMGVKH